ncbi:DUF4160 domain-containing protein [Marinospirillum perlucidum]|uniref:DUF4160 domain-containing protein n=1 Tax=Marinospirillum perlucidum TaxID=1982602 RepID=UPI000DF37E75|nr:DUF4160 domain-containing protein [Marinospirillum perlucidum]
MPKIFEYFGIILLFYSNEHEPVHVHGKYQGHESKAEFILVNGQIKDILIKAVKGRKPLPPAQLRDFKSFTAVYADEIVAKWVDYFVYHRQFECQRIDEKVK